MNTVDLRPATPDDLDFCFRLHQAAMGDYVAAVWGWDETAQRAYHRGKYRPHHWKIITVDGTDAGVLVVDHHATEDYLGLIELHPRYQGRGIGARILRSLLDAAARRGHDLVLDVLDVNPRARAFYLRHGFHEEGRHGENGHKIRMRAPLRTATTTATTPPRPDH
ncbi:GNAT family N-acetyltransferase [Marinactinospora rubrisoli]|uniref:GNAT family N-acetyltransferase n=1 Tax=Marinactinospora rubrisoli TaxID=2715399 RepID=A0ABW2KPM7_9ACTN